MIGHVPGLNYPKPAVSRQSIASPSKERKTLVSGTQQEDCGDGVGGIQDHVCCHGCQPVSPKPRLLSGVQAPHPPKCYFPCRVQLWCFNDKPMSPSWSAGFMWVEGGKAEAGEAHRASKTRCSCPQSCYQTPFFEA